MIKDMYVFTQMVSFLDRICFNYLEQNYNEDHYVKHVT